MTAPTRRRPTPRTAMTWMTDTSSAKATALTATRSFKTPVQWILPKHMAGRRRCLTSNFFLPPTVYTCAPPSFVISASHVPSSSAILIVDIPHVIDPPSGSLEPCVRALAHDSGTVQTVTRKEGLGKNRNLEGGASHRAQSGVSHNPAPDIIYIYCIFFQCCRLRFILVSCKKPPLQLVSLCKIVDTPKLNE